MTEWWKTQSLIQFEPYSSFCLCGMTSSGKSYFVYKFLQNLDGMYTHSPPTHVYFCYNVYQELYDQIKALKIVTFIQGLPSAEFLDEIAQQGRHVLLVLDDLMPLVAKSPDIECLYTVGVHHRHISALYICQNLYYQGKAARTISLNTFYLILFNNLRGVSQVKTLETQLYPNNPGRLMNAYLDAIKEPYGYLVIDNSPVNNEETYRLRTKILPNEDPVIYTPNSLTIQ